MQKQFDNTVREDGLPAHSFDTLFEDLATLTLNAVRVPGKPESTFDISSVPGGRSNPENDAAGNGM